MFNKLILISGFRKCGTSSLHNYIVNCVPEVTPSSIKEPQYLPLCDSSSIEQKEWYEKLYGYTGEMIDCGLDSSTLIVTEPISYSIAKSIAKEVKVIVVTRDPVKRMISSYWHMASKQNEPEKRSLETIINSIIKANGNDIWTKESETLRNAKVNNKIDINYFNNDYLKKLYNINFDVNIRDEYFMYRYFGGSLYSHWIKNFPSKYIYITSLECLTQKENEIKNIFDYIELPYTDLKSFNIIKNRNKTYNRSGSSLANLVDSFKAIKYIKNNVPQGIKEYLKYRLYGSVEKIDNQTKEKIRLLLSDEYNYWKSHPKDLIWNKFDEN